MNFRELKWEPRLLKEFTLDKVLGSGAYGVVLQAIHFQDTKSYAIKVVAGNIDLARREVDNLLKIPSHPNVVHYHTCWEDEFTVANLTVIKKMLKIKIDDDTFRVPIGSQKLKVLCIQMELCGEDLRSWMGKQKLVDEGRVTKIFLQIAKGLEHIHKQKIIHRDLKPDNIFLGKDDPEIIKIGDLGIATEHLTTKSASHTRRMGTPLYLAPEQGSSRYGRPADLYALGLILFEMLNPKLQPTANYGSYETLFKEFIDLKYKNVLPSTIQTRWPKISDLILKLIKVSPEDRPSFTEIYETFKSTDAIMDKSKQEISPARKVGPKTEPKPVAKSGAKKEFIPKAPILPVQEVCAGCYKPIEGGKITTALDKKWHPEHFQCNRCYKVLDAYFEREGKAYCENDYYELFSPKCAHCHKVIHGTVTTALGKSWHPEHLPSEVPRSDVLLAPQGSLPDVCAGCYKPIEGGKVTTAMGKQWHAEHFQCTRCYKVLDSYFAKDGKAYCESDYHELFSPKCAHCHSAIRETVTSAMGKTWHPEHFRCTKCNKALDGPSYHTKDGKPYCPADYFDLFAPRCAGCKKAITDAKYTTTEDPPGSWHPDCFVCSDCKEPLTKYFTREGKVYCSIHK